MNLPVSIDQLSPAQLDLLQKQILIRQQELLQQALEELKDKTEKLEAALEIKSQQVETLQKRIDNVDLVNQEGDLRQRVNRMISKLAFTNGWTHRRAWNEFKGAMNMAYRMNLQARFDHYEMKVGHRVTMPEFLEAAGLLQDAIRVLDKMINESRSA